MGFGDMPRDSPDWWPVEVNQRLGVLTVSDLDAVHDALISARFPIGYAPLEGRGRFFRRLLSLNHGAHGVASHALDRTGRVWVMSARLCSEFDDPNTIAVLVNAVAMYANEWRTQLDGEIVDQAT
jgi:hypothetical protein